MILTDLLEGTFIIWLKVKAQPERSRAGLFPMGLSEFCFYKLWVSTVSSKQWNLFFFEPSTFKLSNFQLSNFENSTCLPVFAKEFHSVPKPLSLLAGRYLISLHNIISYPETFTPENCSKSISTYNWGVCLKPFLGHCFRFTFGRP